jgi:hypothetical protein
MTKYDQTTISLPQETKRKVRILVAEMGISMGKATLRLIELGLDTHICCNGTINLALPNDGKPTSARAIEESL